MLYFLKKVNEVKKSYFLLINILFTCCWEQTDFHLGRSKGRNKKCNLHLPILSSWGPHLPFIPQCGKEAHNPDQLVLWCVLLVTGGQGWGGRMDQFPLHHQFLATYLNEDGSVTSMYKRHDIFLLNSSMILLWVLYFQGKGELHV